MTPSWHLESSFAVPKYYLCVNYKQLTQQNLKINMFISFTHSRCGIHSLLGPGKTGGRAMVVDFSNREGPEDRE